MTKENLLLFLMKLLKQFSFSSCLLGDLSENKPSVIVAKQHTTLILSKMYKVWEPLCKTLRSQTCSQFAFAMNLIIFQGDTQEKASDSGVTKSRGTESKVYYNISEYFSIVQSFGHDVMLLDPELKNRKHQTFSTSGVYKMTNTVSAVKPDNL